MASLPPRDQFEIRCHDARHSVVKLFAPHGGCIEPCTGSLVTEIAGETFDYFVFHGMMKKNCFRTLHVSSTRYDEPNCLRMARSSLLAVAIHGCDGWEEYIEIGGGNAEWAADLHSQLRRLGYPAGRAGKNHRGDDEKNFVNAAVYKGVQIELSAGFRKSLFPGYPLTLQRDPKTFPLFIGAMREWLKATESILRQSHQEVGT